MKPRYMIALLLVAVCYVASRWTDWYDLDNSQLQPRLPLRSVAPEQVEVVVSSESYPQPASEGTGVSGQSWLTALSPDKALDKPQAKTPKLSLQWKIPCGPGHGAPTVFGDLVLLTIGDEQGVDLQACRIETGAADWKQKLCTSPVQTLHAKGAAATTTPIIADDRVVVCWSDMQQVWMASFDGAGNEIWRTRVGETNAQWGFNSSPVSYRGLVFVNVDNLVSGFVSAFDVQTGKLAWRQKRPDGFEGSYSSPLVIADASGEAIVVLAGLQMIAAYDGSSGEAQWTVPVISDVSAATPVFNGSYLVASSGYREHRMSVNEFKNGIHSAPTEKWSRDKPSEVPYVPTALLSADDLFVMHDDGIGQCYKLLSGKLRWKKRLGTTITASPTWLGGSILICGENGSLLRMESSNGEIIERISLEDPIFASPCVTSERLLVRTQSSLQCFRLQFDSSL